MVVVFLFGLVFGSFVVIQTTPKAKATTAPTITEFPVPTIQSVPADITAGPDGNIWFTEMTGNRIGQVTPSGTIKEFFIPTGFSKPNGIVSGPDQNLWFTDWYRRSIDKITTGGVVTEFHIPSNSQPAMITSGSDGNLWFTEDNGSHIGRITPNGVILEFPLPIGSNGTDGITTGPDGNVWFIERLGNKVGRITPSGSIVEFSIPTNSSYSAGITLGKDGNLWFAQESNIGRITPSGLITEFSVPTSNSYPEGITSGSDGNVWFTEHSGGRVGEITPSGVITEFSVPTSNSYPGGITSGSDGNVWFTETGGNKIGRVNIAQPIKPGGKWVTKTGFNVAVGKNFTFKASAYPTHAGDPAIAHVNFTATWPGHGWVDICGDVTAHTAKNVYSCSTDFTKLNAETPVPQGSLTVTFNVTDAKGNVNNAPNGSIVGQIVYSTNAKVDKAIAWAITQMNSSPANQYKWYGLCEVFVENAYGTQYKELTAQDSYNKYHTST
ncbi:hypothetical protein, partial [Aquabacterium sp.]|uniref:Vgb family protein n=1 Tax=Aquabacterium sp. TaxID=1872578 RepID=UPI0025C0A24D